MLLSLVAVDAETARNISVKVVSGRSTLTLSESTTTGLNISECPFNDPMATRYIKESPSNPMKTPFHDTFNVFLILTAEPRPPENTMK